jgi:hypothetical protein
MGTTAYLQLCLQQNDKEEQIKINDISGEKLTALLLRFSDSHQLTIIDDTVP